MCSTVGCVRMIYPVIPPIRVVLTSFSTGKKYLMEYLFLIMLGKSFLEAGKNGLTKDTKRDATSEEVKKLKEENEFLKKALAESVLDVQRLKKSLGM